MAPRQAPGTSSAQRSRYAARTAAARAPANSAAQFGGAALQPATFTIAQFASYLQISRNHAYTLARIPGKLPILEAGRRRLINKVRLEAMMAAGELSWSAEELRRYRERSAKVKT